MVTLQIFAVDFESQFVIVAELKKEVHGRIAAAGDGRVAPHHPVLPSGICKSEREEGPE